LIPEFERAQVEPYNAIPYNLPLVPADSDMLTRVLSNLCDNALHYTPAGGKITLEARLQGQEIAVAVTDTGKGIPPEALPRIFERFYRVDSARQSTTGGSGLGLAIVQAIVEAHGGKVWAENAPGAGARIIFTLPLQAAGQPSLSDATTLPLFKKGEVRA
jgi:signal transduction histidine kinase